MIWKLRYTMRMWLCGADFATSWYCAGQAARDNNPIAAADEEMSHWLP